MWETKPRMTPQKTSRVLMGPEQVTRPKTLQACVDDVLYFVGGAYQYCAGGKIETNEMGRACGAYGGG
jgi:hypothetical protein